MRAVQSFDKVLKTSSLEQSNFQKILGEVYQQKMYNSQSTTQSAVVSKLMKRHVRRRHRSPHTQHIPMASFQAQEAFRKCHAIRVICCGPDHPRTLEVLNALKAL